MTRSGQHGFFITFEGPEGAGKSTQCARLAADLETAGRDVLLARDPGGCPLSEELRRLLKHFGTAEDVCPEAELLMFGASRAQLTRQVILPHLAAGGVVVCDRFADSTTVYQGVARGLDAGFIDAMHTFTVPRWPELTLLLDVDVETTFRRTGQRAAAINEEADRIEAEDRTFHEAVRNGFLALARSLPERIRVVDAAQPEEIVYAAVREAAFHALDHA
jgi:dTMP kinase